MNTHLSSTVNTRDTVKAPMLAWIVVFTASSFFFWEFLQLNMFDTLTPYLMHDFGTTATQLGYLSGTFTLAEVLFLFPAGIMLDRFGTKRLILIAMLLGVLSTFAFGLATNFIFACFTHFVAGCGAAFCFNSCMKLATRWFPPRRLAFVTGLIVMVAMLGGVTSQAPLHLLCNALGWRSAVMLDALVGGLLMIAIWLFVEDTPPYQLPFHIKPVSTKYSLKKTITAVLKSPQNILCGLYTAVLNLPLAVLGALWGQLYLHQVHHYTYTQASIVTSMLFIGTIVGSPACGWLSDHIGKRRLPMIVGAILAFVLFTLIMRIPHPSIETFSLLFFLLGLITSTQIISYPVITESNPHHLSASSFGLAAVMIIGAYPVTQTLFGYFMDRHWDGKMLHGEHLYTAANFHTALLIIPVGFVIGLVCALFIKETHCEHQNSEA